MGTAIVAGKVLIVKIKVLLQPVDMGRLPAVVFEEMGEVARIFKTEAPGYFGYLPVGVYQQQPGFQQQAHTDMFAHGASGRLFYTCIQMVGMCI